MTATWLEITCNVPDEFVEIVSSYLADLSGSGVCVEI